MSFPSSPVNGQTYKNYEYNSTSGAWVVNVGSKLVMRPANNRPVIYLAATGNWQLIDFSAYVPTEATALVVYVYQATTTKNAIILCSREYGSTIDDRNQTRLAEIYAGDGLNSYLLMAQNQTIKCTGGKFEIAAHNAIYAPESCQFRLQGYYV